MCNRFQFIKRNIISTFHTYPYLMRLLVLQILLLFVVSLWLLISFSSTPSTVLIIGTTGQGSSEVSNLISQSYTDNHVYNSHSIQHLSVSSSPKLLSFDSNSILSTPSSQTPAGQYLERCVEVHPLGTSVSPLSRLRRMTSSHAGHLVRRCVRTSSIVAGIGTCEKNHDKARWARDSWLQALRWMVVSDVFDFELPTVQIQRLRDSELTVHANREVEESWKRAYHTDTVIHPAPGKGTLLNRMDGDFRFLMLPMLINRTYHEKFIPTAQGYNYVPVTPFDARVPHLRQDPFEWILIADDDTYIHFTQLLHVLAHFDSSQPFALGRYKPFLDDNDTSTIALTIRKLFCRADISAQQQQPVCWTQQAKDRAAAAMSDEVGLPQFLTNVSQSMSPACDFGHVFGGGGILLSRGLMDLIPLSHWRRCMDLLHHTIGGDLALTRCVCEAGIGFTDLKPSEKTGIPRFNDHLNDQLTPVIMQTMWIEDPASVPFRKSPTLTVGDISTASEKASTYPANEPSNL